MASEKLKEAMEAQGDDAKMDMSPMIDMVFLLLIFFMVASTLIINKLDPNVKPSVAKKQLPKEASSRKKGAPRNSSRHYIIHISYSKKVK